MNRLQPGDRVRLSEAGKEAQISTKRTTGIVTSVSKTGPYICVLRDGNVKDGWYHESFWEKESEC